MSNPRYRPISQTLTGRNCLTGEEARVSVDDSQNFPDHIHLFPQAPSIDLPREEVERLRDWLTAWLEYDPDAEVIEAMAKGICTERATRSNWDYYLPDARAALAAYRAHTGES